MENINNAIPVNIEDEMRGSYLDYAMSVIIGRALPDVRDGLKPVHRRILYAMLGEGLTSNRKTSKCAGVVGEVLKRLHPHGDSAVYDALVRMAQSWNMRYPLIEGQGNFGSIDGDPAAAYRYTECRMEALAESMLADIDMETVDFTANFDDTSLEPSVLPSKVPNLLINGAEGIAVGMASKIPPHNLGEIIAATVHLIKNPAAEIDDLMEFVPGPDFPTGGMIYGSGPLKQIYRTGRGVLQIRAKLRTEILSGKKDTTAVIVDEIPFQVNKARLIEHIAELVTEKKIDGISRLRDESDRKGMRVVIELKRDAVEEVVINQLFKLTPLQRSFGVNMLSIVNGVPRVLNLKENLEQFVEHRRSVVIRRSRFELKKAKARIHILEALRTALENIDEVIKLIKESDSTAVAKEALMNRFTFSELQAQQILDMPLRRLTGLERKAIDEEYAEVSARIDYLTMLLGSVEEVNRVIVEELEEIGTKFSDKRRTQIEEDGEEIDLEDMIAEEDMVVSISHRGYAKRSNTTLYKAQGRGGKGVYGTKKLAEDDDDFVSELFVASTHAYLLVFTTAGKLYWLKVYNLPEQGRTARGRALVNLLNLQPEEKVSAILPVRDFVEGKYVVLATRRGYIKRVDLLAFGNVRKGGIIATTLDEGDELIAARLTDGSRDLICSSRTGMAIRFSENDVRPMGRTARGVRAMNLDDDDAVNLVEVSAVAGTEADTERDVALLTVCKNGFGKRTELAEYRCQGRGGKGVIDIKTNERNGNVIGTCLAKAGDDVMIISTAGKVIRIRTKDISLIGRNTMGVNLVTLDEGEGVAAIARLADQDESDDSAGGAVDSAIGDSGIDGAVNGGGNGRVTDDGSEGGETH